MINSSNIDDKHPSFHRLSFSTCPHHLRLLSKMTHVVQARKLQCLQPCRERSKNVSSRNPHLMRFVLRNMKRFIINTAWSHLSASVTRWCEIPTRKINDYIISLPFECVMVTHMFVCQTSLSSCQCPMTSLLFFPLLSWIVGCGQTGKEEWNFFQGEWNVVWRVVSGVSSLFSSHFLFREIIKLTVDFLFCD